MPTTDLMIETLLKTRQQGSGSEEPPVEYFWQLVERYRATLVNQAFAILGNKQDAEDVAQESLCEAYQDLPNLKDAQKFGHWLRQVNRRNAMDLFRHRHREQHGLRQCREMGTDETVSGGFSKVDTREAIARAIDCLPAELQDVVVLRYWEHLPYAEIAARLGIPLGTVKSQLARADAQLEKLLKRYLSESSGQALPEESAGRSGG